MKATQDPYFWAGVFALGLMLAVVGAAVFLAVQLGTLLGSLFAAVMPL